MLTKSTPAYLKPFTASSALQLHFILFVFLFFLSACTSSPKYTTPESLLLAIKHNPEHKACRQLYDEFYQSIILHEVEDNQTQVVNNYPYLHVNRFLSAFTIKISETDKIDAWLDQLQRLALKTQNIEFNNLPVAAKGRLEKIARSMTSNKQRPLDSFTDTLAYCSSKLREIELTAAENFTHILQQKDVPDNYKDWQRVIGIYPVTAIPVIVGINSWHTVSTTHFQHRDNQGKDKTRIRYYPIDTSHIMKQPNTETIIKNAIHPPLNIPTFNDAELDLLFTNYAPIYEIEVDTEDDKLGKPTWVKGKIVIDTQQPISYSLLSYTFFNKQILPQLVYVTWFPSRPCTSFIDILCGNLDGIMWRVTLDHNGKPVHYDSAHNCGCYHTFFPTRELLKKQPTSSFNEWAFSPAEAPELNGGERIVLRVQATTHHLTGIDKSTSTQKGKESIPYHFKDYDQLRSLTYNTNQHKSLFQPDGMVQNTERAERFILWPMGVASPGAMRQWGNHATAFVGKRYFDDPCLMDLYYKPASQSSFNHKTTNTCKK